METKRFKMVDVGFVCEECHKRVEPLKITARDHCPYCLCSKHVDINPGDRKNKCRGILRPISIDKYKDTYKIVYKCDRCKQIHRNIMAIDDNFEKILEVMKNVE